MQIQSEESGVQRTKRVLSKIAIVTIMVIFWGLLLGWPLYNWLAS